MCHISGGPTGAPSGSHCPLHLLLATRQSPLLRHNAIVRKTKVLQPQPAESPLHETR